MFETQLIARAASLAFDSAGRSIAASMAMIAITTRSSIRVKWRFEFEFFMAVSNKKRHDASLLLEIAHAFLTHHVNCVKSIPQAASAAIRRTSVRDAV